MPLPSNEPAAAGSETSEKVVPASGIISQTSGSDEVFPPRQPVVEPVRLLPKKIKKRCVVCLVGAVAAVLVVIGSAFGYVQYVKYVRPMAVEQLLPIDADLVIKLNVNPDADQYRFLEENLQKFPGYNLLKQKVNEKGGDKPVGQVMQDKLSRMGLDFHKDIQPALGDKIYLLIPDAKAVKEAVPSGLMVMEKLPFAGQIVGQRTQVGEQGIAVTRPDLAGPRVMGETDNFSDTVSGDNRPLPRIDYIAAGEIDDLGKAEQILEKLKTDSNYEMTELNYQGFHYLKLKKKVPSGKDGEVEVEVFNFNECFSALVGKNFFMASKEDDLKKIIEKKSKQSLWGGGEEIPSLATDNNYYLSGIGMEENRGYLVDFYYDLDFSSFFQEEQNCVGCESFTDLVQFPKRFSGRYWLHFSPDGFEVLSSSNQMKIPPAMNRPKEESLAMVIPEKVNGKWVDFFFEMNNPAQLYETFKEDHLTQKGKESWQNSLNLMEEETGVNFEKEVAQQLVGPAAVIMATKPKEIPEWGMVAEVKDPAQGIETMKKLVEVIKQERIRSYENQIRMYEADGQLSGGWETTPEMLAYWQQQKQKAIDNLNLVKQAALTETATEHGIIYSFNLPLEVSSVSLDFCASKDMVIVGSRLNLADGLLRELATNQSTKLGKNGFFEKISKSADQQAFSNFFLHNEGVWNAIDYYMDQSGITATTATEADSQTMAWEQNWKEGFWSIGAIIRTAKLSYSSATTKNDMVYSSWVTNIIDLPAEEKKRAERGLQQLIDESTPPYPDDEPTPEPQAADQPRGMANFVADELDAVAKATLSSMASVAAMCKLDNGTVLPPISPTTGGGSVCDIASNTETWPALSPDLVNAGYHYGETDNDFLTIMKNEIVIYSCDVNTGSCQ